MEVNQIKIPDGWSRTSIKNTIIEKQKSQFKVLDATNFGNIPFYTSGKSILLHNEKIIDGKNLFLSTGGVANVEFYDGSVAYSTDTYALTTNQILDEKYLFYFILKNLYYINNNYFLGSGLKHLQKKDFKNHNFIFPKSTTEQQKIAEILTKVDTTIEQTESLIKKFQHIKTGLMQDLLTKGIDSDGNIRSEKTHKFKDSPLGRIPIEWEVIKLGKGIRKIEAGKSWQCVNTPAGHNQWGIVKVSAINHNGFRELENKVILNEALVNQDYQIKDNDFLLSRANTLEIVGDVCIVKNPPSNLLLSDKSLRIIFKEKLLNQEFAFYSLLKFSSRTQIEMNATGSSATMKNISQESISNILISKPTTVLEQSLIVEKIDSIKEDISLQKVTLTKLKRVKTGLMQDLLSGQIRVTNLLKGDGNDTKQ